MNTSYDIVVIGGGHAGIEAAHAGARMGRAVLMVTLDTRAIGRMSCNPAIGGVAKGQLVRDIDALGGLMGEAADASGIQFRMLNRSKGPAVWGPRAQMDMEAYADWMQDRLSRTDGLTLWSGELLEYEREADGFSLRLQGVSGEETVRSRTLIITSGTFLAARMYTGLTPVEGGRIGEPAANRLARCLRLRGLRTRRLKTGTPARLAADSLDYGEVEEQPGDAEPFPFSFRTRGRLRNSAVCWITRTSPLTHDILRSGFDRSPMFTGAIEGLGPRYCPSIEDKVNRFSDKDSHQLFLEPEGLANGRIYVNGFSSSLPAEVQDAALRTLPGLRHCRVLRYGYAVEYDAVDASDLRPSLESRAEPGLYFAGQVNGTSGYEEAAAQGLMAGINAALAVGGGGEFVLGRDQSYIGVMIDDLTRLRLDEPYRMFTSRAEYRLQLRQDNAEERLLGEGVRLGLVDDAQRRLYASWVAPIEALRARLGETRLPAAQWRPFLEAQGGQAGSEPMTALALLRRPEVHARPLLEFLGWLDPAWGERECIALEAAERYAGFKERQERELSRIRKWAHWSIPESARFDEAAGVSLEARQRIAEARPKTLGEAQRLAGVTPADISALWYHLQKEGASG